MAYQVRPWGLIAFHFCAIGNARESEREQERKRETIGWETTTTVFTFRSPVEL
jgi:hypothetical protein